MKNFVNDIINGGYKGGTLALCLVMLFTMTVGLAGCNQQQDIQRVLNLIPTVEGITNSVGSLVASVDPAIAVPVNASLAIVDASFATVKGILTTYENDLSSAPQSVIATLDAAIAAIQANLSAIQVNLSAIEAQFPGLSAVIVAGISVGLSALEAILGYIANLVPASVAAKLFPKSYKLMAQRGVTFGAMSTVPSDREFVKSYNSKLDAVAGGTFKKNKKAHLHTPWIHVGPVPVLP